MTNEAKLKDLSTPGIAFVTGGRRGLGAAIALSFAKNGATGIALLDIHDDETMEKSKIAIEAYGTKCITIEADTTIEEQMERAVAQTVREFGRIDYAANFAGVITSLDRIDAMNLKEFLHTMNVNCIGVLISMKYELRQMMKQDPKASEPGGFSQRGSIVNAASVNSSQTMAGTAAYTASKHAVAGLTKTGALEGRSHGIRVNAVAPGFMRTDMNNGGMIGAIGQEAGEVSKLWATFEARQGRAGQFGEIGDAVVLLSSPKMSFVNGAILPVDNGFVVSEAASDVGVIEKVL